MKNQKIKMEIGNEVFNLKTGEYVFERRCNSLFDFYVKPSEAKISIYQHWIKWFIDNSENVNDCICIRSVNRNMFTMNGFITINGIEYYFLITPTKKEIYEK